MKTAKDYLEAEVRKHADAAKAITRKAEDENRSLTEDEVNEVNRHVAEATTLKSRIGEIEDNERLQAAIDVVGQTVSGEPSEAPEENSKLSVGEQFVKSEAFKALKTRGLHGRWSTGPIELATGAKAPPAGTVWEGAGDNADLFTPQRVPGIFGPSNEIRPRLAELFGQGTATSTSVSVIRETLTDNNADITGEGDEKPASYLEFTPETTPIVKVTTFLPVTDEMLEDEPQMQSYLNGRLSLFVRQREDAYLLARILAEAGQSADAGDIDGDNTFDAILAGITKVRTESDLEPDAVVISAMDFARMSVLKDGVNGGYFSGGPYAAAANAPWGLRTVITNRVPDGTILVGSFAAGATVWRKGGLSVEASNSHADYFRRNMTAIRAEERLALAVYRPDAFCIVTPGAGS